MPTINKRVDPPPPPPLPHAKEVSLEPGAVVNQIKKKIKMNPWDVENPYSDESSDEYEQHVYGDEGNKKSNEQERKYFVRYQPPETKTDSSSTTPSATPDILDGSKYLNKWIDSTLNSRKKALIKKYRDGSFQLLESDDKNYWKSLTKEQLEKSVKFDQFMPHNAVTKKQVTESYLMSMRMNT